MTYKGDRTLIFCHAGCAPEDVLAAIGLTLRDLYDRPQDRETNSTRLQIRTTTKAASNSPNERKIYEYRDLDCEPSYRIVRSPGKSFHAEHWATGSGGYERGMGNAKPILYRLPQVHEAVAEGRWVFVVEGEKDADRLWQEDLAATTAPFGSGAEKWEATDSLVLDGADVIVIGDNDRQGQEHAAAIVESLGGRAKRVRLLDLKGLVQKKGDISDWLEAGGTVEELKRIVKDLPPNRAPQPRFAPAVPRDVSGRWEAYATDDLREWANQPIVWRVRGLLIKDTYGIVGGPKKTLKSTLITGELAYAVANGVNWLNAPGFEVLSPCPVVVVMNEGIRPYVRSLERTRDRNGADCLGPIRLIPAQGGKWRDPDLESLIRTTVEDTDAGLIIFDSLYGFISAEADPGSIFSMADELGHIQNLGAELGADVLAVHHFTKNQRKGRPDLDDLSWAAFAEWSDSWALLKHVAQPDVQAGQYQIGVVAGSRQWGEFTYEIAGDFGPIHPDSIGPIQPPKWTVKSVSSEEADNWGRKEATNASPEDLLQFVEENHFTLSKTALAEEGPGPEKKNQELLKQWLQSGILETRKLPRREKNAIRRRWLVGIAGREPPEPPTNEGSPKE